MPLTSNLKSSTLTLIFLFAGYGLFGQVFWSESFETKGDGTQTAAPDIGTPNWSVTTGTVSQISKQTHLGSWQGIQINQTGATEVVWTTNPINISAYAEVAISMELGYAGTEATDYVRVYYKLNNGPEYPFGEQVGQGFWDIDLSNIASVILSGTTVEIVVRGRENTAGNYLVFSGEPIAMGFDNLVVTGIRNLYSIASADWGTIGTWSYDSHTGASCGCIPNQNTHVIIGNGHTVNIAGASEGVNLTVRNTGTLRWTSNSELNILRGGDITVEMGGNILINGFNGSQIDFDWAVPSNISIASGSTLSVGSIELNGATTYNFSGAGTLATSGDFIINASSTITNDMTGSFTVGDDIIFNSSNNTFTTNGPITAADLTAADNGDNGNTFTIASTASLAVGSITPNDGDLTINNNGTINQSGNFGTVDNGSRYYNLGTGTWNWTHVPGAAFDGSMNAVLVASAAGNNFYYSGNGNQNIIPTTYYNLYTSNSGTKTASATLDVNGNLTIGDGTILTAGTNAWDVEGTVTYNGSGSSIGSGTIDVVGDITINNTGALGGSVTVNAHSNIIAHNTSATPVAVSTTGNITVDNDFTLNGSAVKSGNGVATISGNLTLNNSASWTSTNVTNVAGDLALNNASTWTGGGTTSVTGNLTLDNTSNWSGGGTTNVTQDLTLNTSSNWSGAGTASITGDLTLENSSTWSGNTTFVVTGDLSINSTAVLGGTGNITLAGNWQANSAASFTEGTRLVTFNGALAQSITNNAGTETFASVTINKSAAANTVTMQDNVTIGTTLTLTRGRLSINGFTLALTQAATGALSGGSANSFVLSETTASPYSRMTRAIPNSGTGAYTFPFGNAGGSYIPYVFTRANGATGGNGTLSVATFPTANNNRPYPSSVTHTSNVSGVDQSTLVVNRFWMVDEAAGNVGGSQAFQWAASEADASVANRVAQRWNGTDTWTTGVGSGAGNPITAPSSALNTSSIWVVASVSAALPVEWLDFNATLKNHQVHISWKTATELNNDFFTVERAYDVEHFEEVAVIKGKGNSLEVSKYSVVDHHPIFGTSYYRIKQTDFDGTVSHSNIRKVTYDGEGFANLEAYPNPGDGKAVTIEIKGLDDQNNVQLEICNLQGKTVFRKELTVKTPGYLKENIIFSNELPSGLYIIKAGATSYLTRKILVR